MKLVWCVESNSLITAQHAQPHLYIIKGYAFFVVNIAEHMWTFLKAPELFEMRNLSN